MAMRRALSPAARESCFAAAVVLSSDIADAVEIVPFRASPDVRTGVFRLLF
jgi:hypothetical protein